MKTTVAVIVAGGTGSRMGGAVPKLFRPLRGKPVLWHSLQAFTRHPEISQTVLVHHADHGEYLAPILAEFPQVKAVLGGETRQQSVKNGLEFLNQEGNKGEVSRPNRAQSKVLIHDGARPMVSAALISRVIASEALAVLPVIAVTDTIKHKDGHTLNRRELFAAQTPQGFDFNTILKLHRGAKAEVTDDAMLAEAAGIKVEFVEGDVRNRKITTEEDLNQMSDVGCQLSVRVGNGYDVHAFVPHEGAEKTIKICGVAVECEMAIEGHSDGDVGLHALTDAILGAISEGDIGHHFSSDNPQWKGADSELFLKEAIRLMQEKGGTLAHADVTVIAQMPKLAPHREAMRARIAGICGVAVECISVKATTTDHLGFIGRKEGLAAQATATIRL